jgi:hypothetical protein
MPPGLRSKATKGQQKGKDHCMEPRISLVTLGVSDLKRVTRFYEVEVYLPEEGERA